MPTSYYDELRAEEPDVMPMKRCLTVAAVLAGFFAMAANQAPAVGADLDRYPVVKKRAYHKAHHRRHAYWLREDPYAYQYEPRGYYPYYRSDYWRPAGYVRYRSRVHYNVWNTRPPHFRYHRSWGYPVRHWRHKEWHARHHGRHWPWHW